MVNGTLMLPLLLPSVHASPRARVAVGAVSAPTKAKKQHAATASAATPPMTLRIAGLEWNTPFESAGVIRFAGNQSGIFFPLASHLSHFFDQLRSSKQAQRRVPRARVPHFVATLQRRTMRTDIKRAIALVALVTAVVVLPSIADEDQYEVELDGQGHAVASPPDFDPAPPVDAPDAFASAAQHPFPASAEPFLGPTASKTTPMSACKPPRPDSPAVAAVKKGDIGTVRSLLQEQLDLATAPQDDSGTTLLMVAAAHDQRDIARLLLEHGADANAVAARGWSPLTYAVVEQHLDMLELLLEHGADVHHVDMMQRSLVLEAAARPDVAILRRLLEAGAEAGLGDGQGITPIMVAAFTNSYRAIPELASHGADLTARNEAGLDALILAAQHGSTDAIRTLLELGAELEVKDAVEMTPLLWAASGGHTKAAEVRAAHAATALHVHASLDADHHSLPAGAAAGRSRPSCAKQRWV